ncbi:DUF6482 family protein [Gallaecimonas mangrovi]|uniref:DUF6482 family protein n=1 Tax=Gallaecimonas mangrovi TaxID=2291597 RepID=UPI000E20BCBA|nr:DUF6482 family protein [Gallaecimonas mangrovi]
MLVAEFESALDNGFKPPLEIVATEMVIFLVRVRIGEQLLWLKENDGSLLRFTSSQQACRWLWDRGVREATLVTQGYWDAEVGGGSDPGIRHPLLFKERP